ncbi:MAG: sarcosine oxidase subunit delta [Actinobacteria bacterium]|nr:sarcosine oxidase subunit delta [Actinomycetota bacterium]
MKIMPCPVNGPRNIAEFVCGGEVIVPPDPDACDDAAWAEHLFMRTNAAGVVREWWYHVPTSFWFIAERNTVTDDIVRTYLPDEIFGTERTPHREPGRA